MSSTIYYRIRGRAIMFVGSFSGSESGYYLIKGVINMNDVYNEVYEGICSVAKSGTDFEVGFESLFDFMCDHPEATSTKEFIEYHISEMGDPRLPDGRPCFAYLIGRHFSVANWVSQEDVDQFNKYYRDIL